MDEEALQDSDRRRVDVVLDALQELLDFLDAPQRDDGLGADEDLQDDHADAPLVPEARSRRKMSAQLQDLLATVRQVAGVRLFLLLAVLGDVVEAAELELFVVVVERDESGIDIPEDHLELLQLQHSEQQVLDDLLAFSLHHSSVSDDITKSIRKDLKHQAGLHADPFELLEVRNMRGSFLLRIH